MGLFTSCHLERVLNVRSSIQTLLGADVLLIRSRWIEQWKRFSRVEGLLVYQQSVDVFVLRQI